MSKLNSVAVRAAQHSKARAAGTAATSICNKLIHIWIHGTGRPSVVDSCFWCSRILEQYEAADPATRDPVHVPAPPPALTTRPDVYGVDEAPDAT